MRCVNTPRVLMAVSLACLGVAAPPANAADPVRSNGWIMNDLAAAQAEATKTGKPIFAVFRCEA